MQRVEPSAWVIAVRDAITAGHAEFVTLIGLDDDGVQVLLRLRDASGHDLVLATDAAAGVDSVVILLPQAAWYEREAAEMYGIAFHGHDTRPLLLPEGSPPLMRRSEWLEARQSTPWPGEKEPGGVAARRRQRPPGVRA